MTSKDSPSRSLLLVEDDSFLRDIISRKLIESFELLSTTGGEEAIAIAKEKKPLVILLDLNLPGLNGFEVLKKIRADEELKDTLVLILTNSVLSQDVIKSNELQADDFLTKANFSTDEIVERIEKHLEAKKSKE